jgi:hypothetical protein
MTSTGPHAPPTDLMVPRTDRWEILIWGLRGVVVATAITLFTTGSILCGLFCVTAGALAVTPAMLAHSHRARLPATLELALLWLIVADLTLGRLIGLYELLPWYDKALHLGDSCVIAMIAFVVVYLLHFIGHTHRRPWIDAMCILLITLGVGAGWEICEYLADQLFRGATQGSPLLPPLDDTMFDLMLDGTGGMIVAITGPIYMRRSKRSRLHIRAFAELMDIKHKRRAARGR